MGNVTLPCVNKPREGAAYPTVKEMCQHEAVVIMPQESITVLKTLDLGSGPLEDIGVVTVADLDFGDGNDEEGEDEDDYDYDFEYADDEAFIIEGDASEDQPDAEDLVAETNFDEELEELEIPLYDYYDDEVAEEDDETFRNKVEEEP